MKQLQFGTGHLIGLVTAIAVLTCAGNALNRMARHATSTRTIVAMDLSGNKRIRLIQNFRGEPWDTKLYFDAGDGSWGFYYYEHEDWYWNEAEVDVQGDVVSISRNSRLTIQFNVRTGTCMVDRADGWRHEHDAPAYYLTDTRDPILVELEREAKASFVDQTVADDDPRNDGIFLHNQSSGVPFLDL